MLLATPLLCLALVTCHDTLGPSPRLPRGEPGALVTVEDTLVASSDTHISKTTPNQNFGANDEMRVGGTSRYRALVQFDSALIRQAVGTGQLDSARLEFTIVANPDGFGSGGRQVDLHRLTRSWTESGATWHCPHDADLSNAAPDCEGTAWDMTNQGQAPYVTTRTARVTVTNGQTGMIRLDVTQDVAGFLAGTVHQGWIFRKYNESEGGQALVLARHTAGAPRLILAVTDVAMPELPDSVLWPVTGALLVPSPSNPSFQYYRNVLGIEFSPSATATDFEALVSKYGATLLGGMGKGSYVPRYVFRFADPGTNYAAVDSLAQQLRSEPGVRSVMLLALAGPLDIRSRFPIDAGMAVSRSEWRGAGTPKTYPWIAVRAPLAWGCETGQYGGSPPALAVLDAWFNSVPSDLVLNGQRFVPQPPDTVTDQPGAFSAANHAIGVSGIIGAHGDNGAQMAGMVWGQPIVAYGFYNNSFQRTANEVDYFWRVIADAIQKQVRVMNVSVAFGDIGNSTNVSDVREHIRRYLDSGSDRLLVIATGNNYLSQPLSQLAASTNSALRASDRAAAQLLLDPSGAYDGKILFVTGTAIGGQRDPATNAWTGDSGSLVAAPSRDIYTLSGSGAVDLWIGSSSSFAAPMVTGLAAQLWTFDPRLTAAEVVSYIIRGAREPRLDSLTNQIVAPNDIGLAGVYQVDAYSSLTLLAKERLDLPLCGNAVWVAGGQLKARRGNSIETLATLNDSAGLVNVLHGGRRVDVYTDLGGKRSFLFDPSDGGWDEALNPYALPDTLPGGTFVGALWASHDGDSTVSVVPAPSGVPGAFEVRLRTGGLTTHTFAVSTSLSSSTGWGIVRQRFGADSAYHPIDSALTGTTQSASARPAYSPTGRRLLVALNRDQQQTSLGGTAPCQGDNSPFPDLCTSLVTVTATLPNEVWEIPLPPGSPHSLGTTGSTHLFWLGESEDGGRLVSGTGVHQASSTIVQNSAGSWQLISDSNQWLNCTVEFRQTANLALLNSELSAEACSPFEAAGSFAPLRAASRR